MTKLFVAFSVILYGGLCWAASEHPINCLNEDTKLVKPVSSASVEPQQAGGPSWDIKNAAEYAGPIGPACKKVFGETGSFRVITQNGKLFFLDLRATTKEPVLVKFLPTSEVSRMQAALRQNGLALANFKLGSDGGVLVTYSVRRWGADFRETVGFLAFEAKYK